MAKDLLALVKEIIEHRKKDRELYGPDQLDEFLDDFVKDHNELTEQMDGISPEAMISLMKDPFEEDSSLTLRYLYDSDYEEIPLLRQIRALIAILQRDNGVKMLPKNRKRGDKIMNLPEEVVSVLYTLGSGSCFEKPLKTVLKEERASVGVHLAHLMLDLMGCIKTQKGVMTLTKKGKDLSNNPQWLLKELLIAFAQEFNFSYFDDFEYSNVSCVSVGLSIVLLGKYGAVPRTHEFYSNKFVSINQYPDDVISDEESYKVSIAQPGIFHDIMVENPFAFCYYRRMFERFMFELGLVKIEHEIGADKKRKIYISKTPLFDRMMTLPAKPGTSFIPPFDMDSVIYN